MTLFPAAGRHPLSVEAELGGLQVTNLTGHTIHGHILAFGSSHLDDNQHEQTIPAHMYQVQLSLFVYV